MAFMTLCSPAPRSLGKSVLLLVAGATAAAAFDAARAPSAPATVLREDCGSMEDSATCLLQREGHALAASAHGQLAAQPKAPSQADVKESNASNNVSLASVSSDGVGFNQSALHQEGLEASVAKHSRAVHMQKDKVVLMLIEMCPFAWLLGADRFYLGSIRTGLAKLLISLATIGLGGLIWGFIDFIAVLVNAFQEKDTLHAMGMSAHFEQGQVRTAFFLAFADLVMLPVWYMLWRFFWQMRQQQRLKALKQAALNSPHFNFKKGTGVEKK